MAIAFDSGTFVQSTTGTTLTFSHTTTGNQRILFVGGHDINGASSIITGITYGGVAMTKINEVRVGTDERWITLWYLLAPATGANNVIVTSSSSENLRFSALSYTGALQSGVPDASATASEGNSTTIATNLTTVKDNCWEIAIGKDDTGNRTWSSSTGDTMRLATDAGGQAWADTGAPITPAGSNDFDLAITGGARKLGMLAASFAPSAVIGGIEFDAVGGEFLTNGATASGSHTCSGSDRILFAGIVNFAPTDDLEAPTYGGVAMTLVDKQGFNSEASPGDWSYLYYLINPASGSNTLSVTRTDTTSSMHMVCTSYTGAKQSGVPDASAKNVQDSGTSLTTSVTTVANDCWTVLFCGAQKEVAPGTGTTERVPGVLGVQNLIGDSNGDITPAGSTSMEVTMGDTTSATIMASFAPSGSAGIQFDAISTGGNGGTSQTFSHTCTGTNRLLFVGAFNQESSSTVTGVTYDGVALTEIDHSSQTSNSVSLWYLIAPSTGASDVVITRSTSTNALVGVAVSYTGCLQSGVPDSDNTGGSGSGTTLTIATTTVEDNCWITGIFRNNSGVNVASSNTTMRNASSIAMGDTNGSQSPAGSHSIGTTWSGSDRNVGVVASFAPAPAVVTAVVRNLMTLGVGR
jgi:hypothetical protein